MSTTGLSPSTGEPRGIYDNMKTAAHCGEGDRTFRSMTTI
jgi:hypothetical protein